MPDGRRARLSAWRAGLRLAALLWVVVPAGSGCAAQRHEARPATTLQGIERPARPLAEEQSVAEHAGNVAVALLVVGVTLAIIVLPIVFLL